MPRGRRQGILVPRVHVWEQWKRVIKYVCVCFSLPCLRPWVEGRGGGDGRCLYVVSGREGVLVPSVCQAVTLATRGASVVAARSGRSTVALGGCVSPLRLRVGLAVELEDSLALVPPSVVRDCEV